MKHIYRLLKANQDPCNIHVYLIINNALYKLIKTSIFLTFYTLSAECNKDMLEACKTTNKLKCKFYNSDNIEKYESEVNKPQ